MTKLTAKQQKFAEQVAIGLPYTEAYLEAYPTSATWTRNALQVESHKTAKKPYVREVISKLVKAARKRNAAELDDVIGLMAEWLNSDPIDLVDEHNCVKDRLPKGEAGKSEALPSCPAQSWGK